MYRECIFQSESLEVVRTASETRIFLENNCLGKEEMAKIIVWRGRIKTLLWCESD